MSPTGTALQLCQAPAPGHRELLSKVLSCWDMGTEPSAPPCHHSSLSPGWGGGNRGAMILPQLQKNLSQSFNVPRKAPNRSSLPSALCLNNRVPIMGCLKGEGQSQGSELSSASLAAMTKAQRTHHPRGLSCWHRAELSKDTLVNTLPWPSPLTRAPERGREKPLSANRHPSLSLDTRTSPSKTSPASLSGLPVEPKNPLAAEEDRCHIKERLNSHKPENLCSGVLTRSSW